MSRHALKLCVLPGDGIGVEVMDVALPVLDALNIPVELQCAEIGWECWKRDGDPVPSPTWQAIKRSDAVLLGAITSKPHTAALAELVPEVRAVSPKYVSPVIQLRQKLDLYANVRPVTDLRHKGDPRFRFTVIRENSEGLYCGLDFHPLPPELCDFVLKNNTQVKRESAEIRNGAATIRLQTPFGLNRLFRFASDYAVANAFTKVTLADKPNVLRHSSELVREIFETVAKDYPQLDYSIENVDAVALRMVSRPEAYGVIVAENMFGDILSDLGAGVMGGLGLAPSGNFGETTPYFEPVHGSAPRYVGTHRANPMAMFLTIAFLLRHYAYRQEAEAIEQACQDVIADGQVTPDLGGTSATRDVAMRIIDKARALLFHKK